MHPGGPRIPAQPDSASQTCGGWGFRSRRAEGFLLVLTKLSLFVEICDSLGEFGGRNWV